MRRPVPPSLFVTATATDSGKTFVTRGLARSAARTGARVAALKPIETGVAPDPRDAVALALAAGRPELAHDPELYRALLPLAPYAVALESGEPPPDVPRLIARVRVLARESDVLLVEGAGGLLVPIDRDRTMADLAQALALPLLMIACDQLGVLSSVLTCVESALSRGLRVTAVILSQHGAASDDPSPRTNQRILQERLPFPVLSFPRCADDDDALADAVDRVGLIEALHAELRRQGSLRTPAPPAVD
jgi:dethiobiotin synthetase